MNLWFVLVMKCIGNFSNKKYSSSKLLSREIMGSMRTAHVLLAMRALLVLVFLSWLMIWVVMPTKTYRNKWSAELLSATLSTFLGSQGTWMLIFTFPILLIAVVGCLYLHLAERSRYFNRRLFNDRGEISRRLRGWRKPALVKGPLGVISAVEIGFCFMFLFLVIWALYMYITGGLSEVSSGVAAEYGEKLWEAKLYDVGLQFGLTGNMCVAFLFFPVARGSSLLPLIGLTSENSIRYHIWLGHLVMALFTAHGLCYLIVWVINGRIYELVKWGSVGISNIAGEVALLCGLAMWAVSFPRFRRSMFELFFYAHYLYIPFLLFYLLHIGFSAFCLILPGVYLFLVDRFLRLLQSRRRVRLLSARLLQSETMELNFAKAPGFSYNPTSVVFIKVPSISSLQWHPFTVSSSSSLEPENLSIVIKKSGRWTHKLFEQLSQPSLQCLEVAVEGPYSPGSTDFLSYDSLILVSGGSGITPFISIIRELIHHSATLSAKTPTILLISTFKTTADLSMLDLLLPISNATTTTNFSQLQLQVMAFVTREQQAPPPAANGDAEAKKLIYFNPDPSDAAVAPVLGPNGWLWLAAVISSSFLAFLLLIGILTRYYIYPIDDNTDEVFSYTKRALLYLLVMCWCIAAMAGLAVLWNKKVNCKEECSPEPAMMPKNLWTLGGEIESEPREALLGGVKVQYGERPNLKKLLLEFGDKSSIIGVMASGPSSLRREVAAICSSTPAENLHYKSLSFTW
ncbi:ferric reduction oxidase 2 isoform X3 [Dendrobium catenatum]|uniref:ferric reduction oxidase 2 isoform X3 n=1 Tax=Dendrobium catenatum TaxID=906689 RepID=UPI0009F511E1|nr:ferric reduction oxidase 2 isoform X3 [Dendrobium catenatum]